MESETWCFSCSRTSSLISMHASVYAGLGNRVGHLPNLLQEMNEYVRHRTLLETAYARPSHVTQRRPKSTTRTARFLDEKYGADGKSKRLLDWKQSSLCHYWIEGSPNEVVGQHSSISSTVSLSNFLPFLGCIFSNVSLSFSLRRSSRLVHSPPFTAL